MIVTTDQYERLTRSVSEVVPVNRRAMLRAVGGGFGATALAGILGANVANASAASSRREPHFPAKAKHIIFLFMPGGPSQVDTYDPKPRLSRDNGKPSPRLYLGKQRDLRGSPWKFSRYGESGTDVSDLFPHTARCVDDMCIVRSMVADDVNHPGGCLQMNTGERVFSRPSMGSWILYGLGTENDNLPGFIAIGPGPIIEGARQYGSGFLPATYQGTFIRDLQSPIRNLKNHYSSAMEQRQDLDALRALNELHRSSRLEDSRLNARIESFELAFRMQMEAPEAFDLAREGQRTQRLYGLDGEKTAVFGRQCLMARRLVERGVRFVQLYDTTGGFQPWDQHGGLESGHEANALRTDRPIAGLLQDLKQRGMLDETLVIWGGEFGRTPAAQGDGRDHHPYGFTMWLAGGGVRGGMRYGKTDELGWDAVEDRMHVHDLHATILHLMGLDHTALTYRFAGRDYRLTDVFGEVATGIIA